jgi:hypothetical protein
LTDGTEARTATVVEISLGVRPTEVRARLQRLERQGAGHWLLRGLSHSRAVYASKEEEDALREWLATSHGSLSARRQISNALVTHEVELRSEWRLTRPPSVTVTVAGRPYASLEYKQAAPGWAVRFVGAARGSPSRFTVESLSAQQPDDLEGSRELRDAALDTALQVTVSRLARRPLHIATKQA